MIHNICLIFLVIAAGINFNLVNSNDTVGSNDLSKIVGSCSYTNPFAKAKECREYIGEYTQDEVKLICSKVFTGVSGELNLGKGCDPDGAIGSCLVQEKNTGGKKKTYICRIYEGDASLNAALCKKFVEGTWTFGNGGDGDQIQQPINTGDSKLESLAIQGMISDKFVKVIPKDCFDSICLDQLLGNDSFIEIFPQDLPKPTTGLIFYGGGKVDPRAYSPVMKRIAKEARILVVLVPFPNNIPIVNPTAATNVISKRPYIQQWFIGGHSLGGTAISKLMADIYNSNNNNFDELKQHQKNIIKGILYYASYPSPENSLADFTTLPLLSIWATQDGVATPAKIERNKFLLPKNYIEEIIQGGNHAYFGSYGEQEGDAIASISITRQHELVAAASIRFILNPFYQNLIQTNFYKKIVDHQDIINGNWCKRAQILFSEGLLHENIKNPILEVKDWKTIDEFAKSKAYTTIPELDGKFSSISIQSISFQGGEQYSKFVPAFYYPGEIVCKTKSRFAIEKLFTQSNLAVKQYDNDDNNSEMKLLGNIQERYSCSNLNRQALHWAFNQFPDKIKKRYYENETPKVIFLPDLLFSTGIEWLQSQVLIEQDYLSGNIVIQSTSIRVENDESVPEPFRNNRYCKLWSPVAAVAWIQEYVVDSFENNNKNCDMSVFRGICKLTSTIEGKQPYSNCNSGYAEFSKCSKPLYGGLFTDKFCCKVDTSFIPEQLCLNNRNEEKLKLLPVEQQLLIKNSPCLVQSSYLPYKGCAADHIEIPQCTEPTLLVPFKFEFCCPVDFVAKFKALQKNISTATVTTTTTTTTTTNNNNIQVENENKSETNIPDKIEKKEEL